MRVSHILKGRKISELPESDQAIIRRMMLTDAEVMAIWRIKEAGIDIAKVKKVWGQIKRIQEAATEA